MAGKIAKIKHSHDGTLHTIYPVTVASAIPDLEDAVVTFSPPANLSDVVKLNNAQTITGAKTFEGTSITLYSRRLNNNAGIYAGMVMERHTTSSSTTAPSTFGIGAYFKAKSVVGAMTHAGLFGGRLTPAVGGETTHQVGEVVFSPAWNNVDPYRRADLRIRATGANTANVYLRGDFYANSTDTGKTGKKLATEEFVNNKGYALDSTLKTVAKTGSYNDLTDKPTIPTIPNLTISGGAEEANKYISKITVSGHSITVTKGTLPTFSYTLPLAGASTRGGIRASARNASTDTVEVKINSTNEKLYVPKYPVIPSNATQTVAGLMSAADKKLLDAISAVWESDGSANNVVDKLKEVLAAFENFPESDNLFSLLSAKVNTTDLKAVATSGKYSDLTGRPTKLSDFNNDQNFITSSSTLGANKLSGLIPSAVLATTQLSSDNSQKIATTAFVKTVIAGLDIVSSWDEIEDMPGNIIREASWNGTTKTLVIEVL